MNDETFTHRTNDPHTAIPDWLPFVAGIGPEARNLIMASLVLEKRGGPPTRRQLALALGVDERSIYRWLKEIASAGALSTRRDSRRRVNVFHRPTSDHVSMITDRPITDRMISDRTISDHAIRYTRKQVERAPALESHETAIPDRTISDPPVVGVGDHVLADSEPTPTTRRGPLKTPLARWAKQYGMNAAWIIDDPMLDYATYKRWIEDHRAMGWEWRQIVSTLRQAPLEAPALAEARDLADGDLAGAGDLAGLDSTSRQLARRFEQDRQLAQLRGAGLVDERGKPV